MIQSAPTKILIGISFDQERSMELLSSAICNLARPNDTVVALHVLVAQTTKKHTDKRGVSKSINRYRTRIRKAKAFVISVTGEFANVCRAKQVKLEARVGFSSSVGKGLVEEAKNMSSRYLLISSKSNDSNRFAFMIRVHQTQKYCLDNSPKSCSIVLVQKSDMKKQDFHSGNINEEDFSNKKSEQRSPRNVLDLSERDYHSTEEDSSSFEGSSIMESPPPLVARKSKGQSSFRKHISSLKRISSFLRSPFEPDTRKADMKLPIKEQQQTLLKCLSYEELAKATNNFHPDNIVGIGGYSEVYKGDLENGQVIAVKKLAKDNKDQNKEKEFLMELGILGHINHPNTASLVGCCVENGLYLIFNYYPNGTLSSALHGKTGKHIEWPERYKIAVGIARGLHYLHTCCKHRIIHRDIKASNVLLGPDFEPQISDFGLAKWLPSKWTHHAVIPIEGTFGYLAPEYFMHGIVDEKTDVFAFGVLLLEIITGRMPVDSDKQNLVLWAKPLMDSRDICRLIDPDLEGEYDSDQLYRLVLTSSYCVQQSSDWRPSMTEVLEVLQHGDDSEFAKSWRIPEFTQEENEMDDYSMIFGYDVPSDISLDDI
ncbi:probable receptor-like serine/threonine-protein kinase At5g57670 [Cynara cardunculus var. scolymus]|uniref:probable receptor-like serine/threonine-protein kinase At5g57670 n=1 Tax=Cynara cardunculus var. scolymus TaxID=59895 RepID=UPI000D62D5FC|nr:probable receptor-like serine/threonine-protein kinase At5g57670 [Cynara cardunculus var. scolymus]